MSTANPDLPFRTSNSERACDFLLLCFGAWTAACHLVVFAGGSLFVLVGLFPLLLAGAMVLQRRLPAQAPSQLATQASQLSLGPRPWIWPLAGALAGGAVALVWITTNSVTATWWAAVFATAGAYALTQSEADPGSPPRIEPGRERLLLVLAVLSALATQLVQRPDIDDCYYVNVSAAIAANPGAALLSGDTLYGIADLPLMLSVYRIHSFEILAGAIAWATPLTAIQAAHLVVPALFGFFIPLAAARLLRRLLPNTWMEALLVTLALLAVTAETHRWWGNFAFVRQQQGKGVFLTVLVPLLISYGLDFARSPSKRGFLRLALAQLAGLGATATALWAAPVAAGLGLAAGASLVPRRLGRASLGLLASAYPIALGLSFRASTAKVVKSLPLPGFDPIEPGDHAALAQSAWEHSMGTGPLALACLFATAGAWGFVPTRGARRALAALSLVFLLLLNSPYTAWYVADGVTSSMTYFRIFWVLPVPILLGVVLSWPARLLSPGLGRAGVAILATLFLVFAPRLYTLDVENNATFDPFALKVLEDEYAAARILVANTPPGSYVAASQFAAVYVGTFEEHPFAVVSRLDYLRFLEPHLTRSDINRRSLLGGALMTPGWVANPAQGQLFGRAMEELDIAGVLFLRVDRSMAGLLSNRGFRRAGTTRRYAVWVRE